MSRLVDRVRRLEERAGNDLPVLVLVEVGIGERRTGEQIWRDMNWKVHPSVEGRPLGFLVIGSRPRGAPPRLMHEWPITDGWPSGCPPPGPPTSADDEAMELEEHLAPRRRPHDPPPGCRH